jgi:hypothetical protein
MSAQGRGRPDEEEKTEAETGGEETPEEKQELPEEWQFIPIKDYIVKGFKPYQKVVKGHRYMTLKRGKFEKSLGLFSDEKWARLLSMYPTEEKVVEEKAEPLSEAERAGRDTYIDKVPDLPIVKPGRSLMGVGFSPPPSLPRQVTVDTTTLIYYEWFKGKGYNGSLGDFLNETVQAYMMLKGVGLAVVIREEESGVENPGNN